MHNSQTSQRSVRQDILASLVVFLIALPLSLGIALASGAPPVAALVAAIVGGAVVGMISGAPLVVTGPAAGLSAMILQYVQTYGLTRLLQITVLAGILQTVMSALRCARLIQKLPKTVVEGVLSAIGLMIVLGQLHIIMGQKIPGSPITNIVSLPKAFMAAMPYSENGMFFKALVIGLVAIATIEGWKRFAKKMSWLPAALPGVLVATVAAIGLDIPRMSVSPMGAYVTDVIGQTFTGSFWTSMVQLFIPALALAVVASAESLLTARSIDVLATKRHMKVNVDVDRELMAQGIGNAISGLLGGLPMTGVMVRSAANLEAGAKTRLSTVLHSVWICLFVLGAPQILSMIPMAALAAVLIITGIKLVNFHHMVQSVRDNPLHAWIWPMTAVAVVTTDLLKGLMIGLAAAMIQHAVLRYRARNVIAETQTEAKPEVN